MPRVELPESLKRCIAQSQVEVLSWSSESGELQIAVVKKTVPETGTILLSGVSHVNMSTRFELVGVGAYDCPFPDYPHLNLKDDEIAVGFQDSESRVLLVIAKSLTYEINAGSER